MSRKIDGVLTELTAYKIDATSARYRIVAEKESPILSSRLCLRNFTKKCQSCVNFKIIEDQDKDTEESSNENNVHTLKDEYWVPVFLTIVVFASLTSSAILIFIVYRYFVEDILDGNPSLTIVLILSTLLMLQSVIPFCIEDKAVDAEHLNSRKIFVSSLSFGVAFSVMLTRALFLAFSTKGVFSTQHINGYLQGLMLFFMAGVEISIASMYFGMSGDDSVKVARSLVYIALLGK